MLAKSVVAKVSYLKRVWGLTAVGWGGVGAVGLVYFTDWRLVLDYVPYINGKFKKGD
ncbi:cytochrome b-c1 complex subunit 10 [Salminus brasiliensis]|uniref:cytochrome b-c1 complex subunit 10 n=1 Tax=Salminus brasiliensis TaxID=930266 RepID=UPI003B8390C3